VGVMIGHGATAIVYKAFLEELKMAVAVKVFLPSDMSDESIKRDISYGLDKRLTSDYTITYLETFVYETYLCVSMPLMEASLQKFLNPYIEKEVKKYFDDDVCCLLFLHTICVQAILLKITKIILGVCVLHFNQVAHFDLKLGNILIDSDDNLKICFFFFILLFYICS
jgi:serine/threonine protein kinase